MKLTELKKELEMLDDSEAFVFTNGAKANSLEEFLEALKIIDSNTFFFHLNGRNDYANWIRGVFGDDELAKKIEKSSDRIEIHDSIEERLIELKDFFIGKNKSPKKVNTSKNNLVSLKEELKSELTDLEKTLKKDLEEDIENKLSKDIRTSIEETSVKNEEEVEKELNTLIKEIDGLKKKFSSTSKTFEKDLREEEEDNLILARAVEFLIGMGFGMIIMYIIQRIL